MVVSKNCRIELIPARRIKRIPGLHGSVSPGNIEKVKEFTKQRGYCRPVVLSDAEGCMTLLAGAATFEACLKEKGAKIPAVIVQTADEADDLMFSLQSAELDDSPGAIAIGGAIVRLIDSYGVPRKNIVMALGKSPSWLTRMESLCRRLNREVQKMVVDGLVASRSAQEIARLPDDVQVPFAAAVSNEYLAKDNVCYLVKRYLDEYTGREERDRIINTPRLAIPNEFKRRGRKGIDGSISARLARAAARCMDDAVYLIRLLDKAEAGEAAIRVEDFIELAGSLTKLRIRVLAFVAPGENNASAGNGEDD